MPVALINENEIGTQVKTVKSIFQNDGKPRDKHTNPQPVARLQQLQPRPSQTNFTLTLPTATQTKSNEDKVAITTSNEKKFSFPPFDLKCRVSAGKQPLFLFAEKIKNHLAIDPHHDHKHYHEHQYHHLNNVVACTDINCTLRYHNALFDNAAKEVNCVIKCPDGIVIHEPSLQTTKLRVQNICCPKEGRIVQEELRKLPGINTIRVNVLGRVAYISYDQDKVTPTEMLDTLNKRHLGASVVDAGTEKNVDQGFPRELKILLTILIIQVVLLGVVLGAMFSHAFWYRWVAIVQICFGMLPVLKKCFHSIYHFQIDLNVLITVTVIGTLGIQQWLEGAAVVFTFIQASFLQEFCFYRVHKAISSLMLGKPSKAVLACTGELVPLEDVSIGMYQE